MNHGGTVFLTSHILEIVERLADHIGIIHQGTLVAQGPLDELRAGAAGAHARGDLHPPGRRRRRGAADARLDGRRALTAAAASRVPLAALAHADELARAHRVARPAGATLARHRADRPDRGGAAGRAGRDRRRGARPARRPRRRAQTATFLGTAAPGGALHPDRAVRHRRGRPAALPGRAPAAQPGPPAAPPHPAPPAVPRRVGELRGQSLDGRPRAPLVTFRSAFVWGGRLFPAVPRGPAASCSFVVGLAIWRARSSSS